MKNYLQSIRENLGEVGLLSNLSPSTALPEIGITQLKGILLLILGYLLSPLSWWNDLFFNLPLAYGFGYLCSWIWSDLLLPASIVGYWLSNIIGILLMQVGAINVLQKQSQERNLKKELLSGFASSTAYTLLILLLMQLKIIDTPHL